MVQAKGKAITDRLYVVAQSGGIAVFDLFDDGSMRPLIGSPFATGAGTFNIVASPDRRFVYVAPGLGLGTPVSWNQSSSPQLATFRIAEDGSPVSVGAALALPKSITPVTMAISRDGHNLYLGVGRGPAGFFRGAIAHYRIDERGCPVPQGDPMPLGRWIDGAAQPIISPDGKNLYVASVIAKAVVRMSIREDGTLSKPVERKISAGVFPITPGVSPDGRYLYVPNEQSKSISGFRIEGDGALTELGGSPYPTGSIPHNPVFSAEGRFIYIANTFSDTITGYEIQPNGDLSPVSGSPFRTRSGPAALARSTDGKWLYLVSSPIFREGSKVIVTSFAILPDGGLMPSEYPPFPTGLRLADGPCVIVLPVGHRG